jgi:hypothetical protein
VRIACRRFVRGRIHKCHDSADDVAGCGSGGVHRAGAAVIGKPCDDGRGRRTSIGSPHPLGGDDHWIACQTDRGGEGVWLIQPDGTEDHRIAAAVADQQLLPD